VSFTDKTQPSNRPRQVLVRDITIVTYYINNLCGKGDVLTQRSIVIF